MKNCLLLLYKIRMIYRYNEVDGNLNLSWSIEKYILPRDMICIFGNLIMEWHWYWVGKLKRCFTCIASNGCSHVIGNLHVPNLILCMNSFILCVSHWYQRNAQGKELLLRSIQSYAKDWETPKYSYQVLKHIAARPWTIQRNKKYSRDHR